MALRSDWSERNCSMARGLDILGDPWSMLVLREVFFGNGRFEDVSHKAGIDDLLTHRVAGVDDTRPGQQRRRLREGGGDHAGAPSEQAHMFVIHSTCGERTSSADSCTACGERLTAENTSWHSLTRTAEPVELATAGAGRRSGAGEGSGAGNGAAA